MLTGCPVCSQHCCTFNCMQMQLKAKTFFKLYTVSKILNILNNFTSVLGKYLLVLFAAWTMEKGWNDKRTRVSLHVSEGKCKFATLKIEKILQHSLEPFHLCTTLIVEEHSWSRSRLYPSHEKPIGDFF